MEYNIKNINADTDRVYVSVDFVKSNATLATHTYSFQSDISEIYSQIQQDADAMVAIQQKADTLQKQVDENTFNLTEEINSLES